MVIPPHSKEKDEGLSEERRKTPIFFRARSSEKERSKRGNGGTCGFSFLDVGAESKWFLSE
jgi:hypothetical protein